MMFQWGNNMKRKLPRILKPWALRSVARKRQVKKIPGVFDHKTMLYIGANPRRIEMVDMFYTAGYEIDVLEAWEPNFLELSKWNMKYQIFKYLYLEDVRLIDEHIHHRLNWDVIMFWHGPEHLPKMDVAPTLEMLERHANHLVILGCPRGKYVQPEVDGNPFERHESYLYEKDFNDLGYLTQTLRPHKTRGSNIVAWKRIK